MDRNEIDEKDYDILITDEQLSELKVALKFVLTYKVIKVDDLIKLLSRCKSQIYRYMWPVEKNDEKNDEKKKKQGTKEINIATYKKCFEFMRTEIANMDTSNKKFNNKDYIENFNKNFPKSLLINPFINIPPKTSDNLAEKQSGDHQEDDHKRFPGGLAEKFYCLFPDTHKISYNQIKYNTGILKIDKDAKTVEFEIENNEPRKYKGTIKFTHGYGYNTIFIILTEMPYPNDNDKEHCEDLYIQFKHYAKHNLSPSDFIVALVLSPSSSVYNRFPTVYRMILSKNPFEEQQKNIILSLLKLSGIDEFYIKEEDLIEIDKQYGENLRKKNEKKMIPVYTFRRSEIEVILENSDEEKKARIISSLRKASLNSLQYDKISDEILNDIDFFANSFQKPANTGKNPPRTK